MIQSLVLVWLRLYRIVLKIDRKQNVHLRKYGLNTAQFDVLAHIGRRKDVTQQALADSLLVTKGNISQLLDRMEQRGWLKRYQDKRSNIVLLTEEGLALHDCVVPAHEEVIASQLMMLSSHETHELLRILRKIDHHIH